MYLIKFFRTVLPVLCIATFTICNIHNASAKKQTILSPWAENLDKNNVLPEYPRPNMVRKNWTNLNGYWEYAIRKISSDKPAQFDGKILVPFCVESKLSGVEKRISKDEYLWYKKELSLSKPNDDQRILLHFGAIDWQSEIWINNTKVGEHEGGFDPFYVDITDALNDSETQKLEVRVWDPTNDGEQPTGKQRIKNKGIFYTPVSGIWQTVWLETVPKNYITDLKITPDVDAQKCFVTVNTSDNSIKSTVKILATADGEIIAEVAAVPGEKTALTVNNPKLWSPENPFLYDLKVQLIDGEPVDEVSSYFGMRKMEIKKDELGNERIYLNNKEFFSFGPLDQGWWPGGLYTAPTDEALKFDIDITLACGFNTIRKHVKVEPARWYYWCDKLGVVVWQDMVPCKGATPPIMKVAPKKRSEELMKYYKKESIALIDNFYNYPSICIWVPFNEGWGQFNTNEIQKWIEAYDPSRLIDGPSGWVDEGYGHFRDMHYYSFGGMCPAEEGRVPVLGEYGGLTLEIEGHTWNIDSRFGYSKSKSIDSYNDDYVRLLKQTKVFKDKGLGAAIYTQTTDVEGETNGFLTYDRKVLKLDTTRAYEAAQLLYQKAKPLNIVLASAELEHGIKWKYRISSEEVKDWNKVKFDDANWNEDDGVFGFRAFRVHNKEVEWDTICDIWLRRKFTVDEIPSGKLYLNVISNANSEIYLNGKLLANLKVEDHKNYYDLKDYDEELRKLLKVGENTFAVHAINPNAEPHKRWKKLVQCFGLGIISEVE